jgi:hypothetical protein
VAAGMGMRRQVEDACGLSLTDWPRRPWRAAAAVPFRLRVCACFSARCFARTRRRCCSSTSRARCSLLLVSMGCGNSQPATSDPTTIATAVLPEPQTNHNTQQTPQHMSQQQQGTPAASSGSNEGKAESTGAGASSSATGSAAAASLSVASPPPVASSPAVVSPRPLGGGHHGRQRFGPPVPVSVLTDSYKASHFLMVSRRSLAL